MLLATYADTKARSDALSASLSGLSCPGATVFVALGHGVPVPACPEDMRLSVHNVPAISDNPRWVENQGFAEAALFAAEQGASCYIWFGTVPFPGGLWIPRLLRERELTDRPILCRGTEVREVRAGGVDYSVKVPAHPDMLLPGDLATVLAPVQRSIPEGKGWLDVFMWTLAPRLAESNVLAEAFAPDELVRDEALDAISEFSAPVPKRKK